MNHKVGRIAFALAVGLLVATMSYRWVTSQAGNTQRMQEEQVVKAARNWLESTLAIGSLTIVDPLAPDRVVGKAYIYPRGADWEVSGFYRRNENDLWHPYLISLDAGLALRSIRISDSALLHRDGEGPLEVLP